MFPPLGFYGRAPGFIALPYHRRKQRIKSFYGGQMITDPLQRVSQKVIFFSKTHFMIALASFSSGLVLDL